MSSDMQLPPPSIGDRPMTLLEAVCHRVYTCTPHAFAHPSALCISVPVRHGTTATTRMALYSTLTLAPETILHVEDVFIKSVLEMWAITLMAYKVEAIKPAIVGGDTTNTLHAGDVLFAMRARGQRNPTSYLPAPQMGFAMTAPCLDNLTQPQPRNFVGYSDSTEPRTYEEYSADNIYDEVRRLAMGSHLVTWCVQNGVFAR